MHRPVAPDIRVFESGALAAAAAAAIADHIAEILGERGHCRFGLSGGSTPQRTYERLAMLPACWADVQLFWGDERCVPPDHEQSNYRLARQTLVDRVGIPESNVMRIRGELGPERAAREYAEVLGEAPIDILLLGMGDDGHTASLFPGEADPSSHERVVAARSPAPPHDRVTLTVKTINEARAVYFLVTGGAKARRLAEVEEQITSGTPRLPAAFVQPASGRLVWLVDHDAAARLPATPS